MVREKVMSEQEYLNRKGVGRLHTAYLKTELYKQQDACQLSMAQIGKLVKEQEQLLVEDYGLVFIKVLQAVEEVNYV